MEQHINHGYGENGIKPPKYIIAKGDLFAIGYKDGLIGIYIDDDGMWNLKMVISSYWLRDLLSVVKKAMTHINK